MNFYKSVFPEKNVFENIGKKGWFGVITIHYLQLLVRPVPPKVIFEILTIAL